jgi:Zn finger protein HypA/HybF involved in hydrogenase expression
MLGDEIKAKCRHCGKESSASNFKLHFEYKMMVCPDCFRNYKDPTKVEVTEAKPKAEPPKPPGWDAEDVYLEQAMQQKIAQTAVCFRTVEGAEYLQCTCTECKYVFKYYRGSRGPSNCPYCDGEVPMPNQHNTK